MPSSPTVAKLIREFFSSAEQKFAVVGASSNRAKFGNRILQWQVGKTVANSPAFFPLFLTLSTDATPSYLYDALEITNIG